MAPFFFFSTCAAMFAAIFAGRADLAVMLLIAAGVWHLASDISMLCDRDKVDRAHRRAYESHRAGEGTGR